MVERARKACRALHLVGSERDFSGACSLALKAEAGGPCTEWILGINGPRPGLQLPANVEWIRLPRGFEGGFEPERVRNSWIRFLIDLLDAFDPQITYVHPGFALLWREGLPEVLGVFPPSVQLEILSSDRKKSHIPETKPERMREVS